MSDSTASLFERAEALSEWWIGDCDVATLASIAALAAEYAEKVEAGTASHFDITTLACHCKVLADDLYELALGRGQQPTKEVSDG